MAASRIGATGKPSPAASLSRSSSVPNTGLSSCQLLSAELQTTAAASDTSGSTAEAPALWRHATHLVAADPTALGQTTKMVEAVASGDVAIAEMSGRTARSQEALAAASTSSLRAPTPSSCQKCGCGSPPARVAS
jgi:hypothetical protein